MPTTYSLQQGTSEERRELGNCTYHLVIIVSHLQLVSQICFLPVDRQLFHQCFYIAGMATAADLKTQKSQQVTGIQHKSIWRKKTPQNNNLILFGLKDFQMKRCPIPVGEGVKKDGWKEQLL